MAKPVLRAAAPSPLHRARTAAIHIAIKQLDMDDSTYRLLLQRITGVRSSRDCTPNQLGLVMEELKALGATFVSKVRRARAQAAPPDKAPLLSKIDALLLDAEPARDRAYADGMAKRMFKVERVEFCASSQLHKLVAALMYDQKRRERAP